MRTSSECGPPLEGVDLPAVNATPSKWSGVCTRDCSGLVSARKITVIQGAGRLVAAEPVPTVQVG